MFSISRLFHTAPSVPHYASESDPLFFIVQHLNCLDITGTSAEGNKPQQLTTRTLFKNTTLRRSNHLAIIRSREE